MGTTVCLPAGPEWTQQCINIVSKPFGMWRGKLIHVHLVVLFRELFYFVVTLVLRFY